MRMIKAGTITASVRKLCMDANYILPCDISDALERDHRLEPWPLAKDVLGDILDNIRIS